MPKYRIDQLIPGLTLAKDLFDTADGRLLMHKGTMINESHLRYMSAWKVKEVEVEETLDMNENCIVKAEVEEENFPSSSNEDNLPPPSPEALEIARAHVLKKFHLNDLDSPPVQIMFDLAVETIARRKDILNLKQKTDRTVKEEFETPPPIAPSPMQIIENEPMLISLPDVFIRINEVLSNPYSTMEESAEILGMDVALTAKLLRLVNSSFYGFPTKVDSLVRAVMVTGTKQLSTLALGISVINMFRDIPPEMVNMKMFWRHSISSGIYAKGLAKFCGDEENERYFVAGVMHDVGRLIIYKNLPVHAKYALHISRIEKKSLLEAERSVLGWDHARLAGLILKKWRFPDSLEKAVRYHHEPALCQYKKEAVFTHLADFISNALEIGTSGSYYLEPFDSEAWDSLDLHPNSLDKIVRGLDEQIKDVLFTFMPDVS